MSYFARYPPKISEINFHKIHIMGCAFPAAVYYNICTLANEDNLQNNQKCWPVLVTQCNYVSSPVRVQKVSRLVGKIGIAMSWPKQSVMGFQVTPYCFPPAKHRDIHKMFKWRHSWYILWIRKRPSLSRIFRTVSCAAVLLSDQLWPQLRL